MTQSKRLTLKEQKMAQGKTDMTDSLASEKMACSETFFLSLDCSVPITGEASGLSCVLGDEMFVVCYPSPALILWTALW